MNSAGSGEGLARAVRPWLAEELQEACPGLLRALESYPEAHQELRKSYLRAAQELPESFDLQQARDCLFEILAFSLAFFNNSFA